MRTVDPPLCWWRSWWIDDRVCTTCWAKLHKRIYKSDDIRTTSSRQMTIRWCRNAWLNFADGLSTQLFSKPSPPTRDAPNGRMEFEIILNFEFQFDKLWTVSPSARRQTQMCAAIQARLWEMQCCKFENLNFETAWGSTQARANMSIRQWTCIRTHANKISVTRSIRTRTCSDINEKTESFAWASATRTNKSVKQEHGNQALASGTRNRLRFPETSERRHVQTSPAKRNRCVRWREKLNVWNANRKFAFRLATATLLARNVWWFTHKRHASLARAPQILFSRDIRTWTSSNIAGKTESLGAMTPDAKKTNWAIRFCGKGSSTANIGSTMMISWRERTQKIPTSTRKPLNGQILHTKSTEWWWNTSIAIFDLTEIRKTDRWTKNAHQNFWNRKTCRLKCHGPAWISRTEFGHALLRRKLLSTFAVHKRQANEQKQQAGSDRRNKCVSLKFDFVFPRDIRTWTSSNIVGKTESLGSMTRRKRIG